MIIYSNDNEMYIKKINEVELQNLGSNLVNYVKSYKSLIRIDDESVEKRLDILYDIGMKIINKEYHMLFHDPTVVELNEIGKTLAEYQYELLEQYDPQVLYMN